MNAPLSIAELERQRDKLNAAERAEARESFLTFYMRMTKFRPEKHHRLLCNILQKLDDDWTDSQGRTLDRLMVFMPRRMAKSLLCTQLFPAWVIGRHPQEKIMSAVHTQKYAEKTGKYVRNYLRSPRYPFDVQLADDSQRKDQWATSEGGEYNGFGLIGGSTHGNPASYLITDDLIKGRKMALSEHMRAEAWETYVADLVSSLQGRMKQVMVTTRWHMDDIPGRILPEDFDGRTGWYKDRTTGEWWYVLCLPAECEHENDPLGRQVGEFMWAEEFGPKFERAKKRGGFIWSALYQQRPVPDEGIHFNSDDFNYYEPGSINLGDLSIYMTSDYAVTDEKESKGDPDYTVHAVWGIDNEWNIYLLDMWRGRTKSDKWVGEFIRLVKHHHPILCGEEQGQILKGVGPFLHNALVRQRVFVRRKQYVSSDGKVQRAQGIIGMVAEGKLWLPIGHPLTSLFEAEMLAFPGGKHDDMVDTASLMANMLRDTLKGKAPTAEKRANMTIKELFEENERMR